MADNKKDQKILDEIRGWINRPPKTSRVVTVTPWIAERLLRDFNTANRKKKPAKINEYAVAMKEGCWELTGDTIKFTALKVMADGQNRLFACIQSDTPFETHMVFGLTEEAFAVIDSGANRSPTDILGLGKITNAAQVGAAVRWAYLFTNEIKNRIPIPNYILLRLTKGEFAGVAASIPHAAKVVYQYRKGAKYPLGPLAALHFMFKQFDEELADLFFDRWAAGASGGRSAPIATMHTLQVQLRDAAFGRVHDNVRNAMIIRCWIAFARDERPKGTKWCVVDRKKKDWFPKIEGPLK